MLLISRIVVMMVREFLFLKFRLKIGIISMNHGPEQ